MKDPSPKPICPKRRLFPYIDLSSNVANTAESISGLTGANKMADKATIVPNNRTFDLSTEPMKQRRSTEPTKVAIMIFLCWPRKR